MADKSGNFFDAETIDQAVRESKKLLGKYVSGGVVLPPVTPPSRPMEAKEAARLFEAVATGKTHPFTPSVAKTARASGIAGAGRVSGATWSPRPGSATADYYRRTTPEQGLEAILDAISEASSDEDTMRAASYWMTRVTNSIYEIIREITEKEE